MVGWEEPIRKQETYSLSEHTAEPISMQETHSLSEHTAEPISMQETHTLTSPLTNLILGSKFLRLGTIYISPICKLSEGFFSLM